MPFKIVRNDLTKMQVDAIVNTANSTPKYSSGIDTAVYKAAGEELLLVERKKIGYMKEGEVAITPGFKLPAKYIIHAVSLVILTGIPVRKISYVIVIKRVLLEYAVFHTERETKNYVAFKEAMKRLER